MQIIHEEVQTIVKEGPLPNDLDKEKASMRKDYSEDLEKNGWWVNTLDSYYKMGENNLTDYLPALDAIDGAYIQQLLKRLVDAGNVIEVVMTPQ